jgi:HK97 gp10 family phage protein
MAIVIEGLDSLMFKLDRMGGNVLDALTLAVKTTTMSAMDDARSIVPIDTSNLHDHILTRWEPSSNGFTGVVFDNVEYADYVERGTTNEFGGIRMAAQPYMMPALNQNRAYFEAQARKELLSEIRRMGG